MSLPSFPQAELGRIIGRIADQSGAVIPGATVTVTDVQRGLWRTLMSSLTMVFESAFVKLLVPLICRTLRALP